MALVSHIMVTSFRKAFQTFVSAATMEACTNLENCRTMLESIYLEGNINFLIGDDLGFLCWQEWEKRAQIIAIHSLPESWGSGLGHAMLAEALDRMSDCKVEL